MMSPDRRGRVWMILLGIGYVNSKRYVDLVRRGQSIDAEKIRKDVHRTFSNNVSFHKKVSLSSISRVLNALVHDLDIRYVQGMNVLLGPLLYVADEVFGFYMFRRLYSLARSYFSQIFAECMLVVPFSRISWALLIQSCSRSYLSIISGVSMGI